LTRLPRPLFKAYYSLVPWINEFIPVTFSPYLPPIVINSLEISKFAQSCIACRQDSGC
jgi:hypothetical protein